MSSANSMGTKEDKCSPSKCWETYNFLVCVKIQLIVNNRMTRTFTSGTAWPMVSSFFPHKPRTTTNHWLITMSMGAFCGLISGSPFLQFWTWNKSCGILWIRAPESCLVKKARRVNMRREATRLNDAFSITCHQLWSSLLIICNISPTWKRIPAWVHGINSSASGL